MQALAAGVAERDGVIGVDDELLGTTALALDVLEGVQRTEAVAQLVAMALAAQRAHAKATVAYVAQLTVLVALLVDDVVAATRAMAEAGVDVDRARELIGAAASKLPVGAGGRPEGSTSPLGARLKR